MEGRKHKQKNLVYLLRKGWSQSCRIRSPPARVRQPARFAMPWECLVHRFPSTCLRPMPLFSTLISWGLSPTQQFSLVLFLYTFVDAIDNPVYGFLSDRTRTRWGRRRLWLMLGAPLLVLCFILFFNPPASLAAGVGIFLHAADVYPDRHAGFPHQCKLRRSVPGAVSHGGGAGENQCNASGFSIDCNGSIHCADADGHGCDWVFGNGHPLRCVGGCSDLVYELGLP